jgi:hypothetical protein
VLARVTLECLAEASHVFGAKQSRSQAVRQARQTGSDVVVLSQQASSFVGVCLDHRREQQAFFEGELLTHLRLEIAPSDQRCTQVVEF